MSVEDFEKHDRARRGQQNDWTAVDALKAAIQAIEEGRINPIDILIIYHHHNLEDGKIYPNYFSSTMDHFKHIAMCEVAKVGAMEDLMEKK